MAQCNFFFSGLKTVRKKILDYGIVGLNELVSYWELKKSKDAFGELNELIQNRNMLMIDSGAFSAFNSGAVIVMDDFIKWHKQLEKECPEHKRMILAGLDDIVSFENSKINQQKTDDAGLKLFPTFHRKDPEHYMDWLLERKYELIGLGGIATGALHEADAIDDFLSYSFERICVDGRPTLRTHLFGISNVEFLQKYPAWSNDSASALFTASYGAMWVPFLDPQTNEPNWTRPMIRLPVSNESNARANKNQHYRTLNPGQREVIDKFIESKGFKVEEIASNSEIRGCFCTLMLQLQTLNYPSDVVFKKAAKDTQLL